MSSQVYYDVKEIIVFDKNKINPGGTSCRSYRHIIYRKGSLEWIQKHSFGIRI